MKKRIVLENQIDIFSFEIKKKKSDPRDEKSIRPKKVFDDFTEDDIFWYMSRLSTKLHEELSYKRVYDLFTQFGKDKVKLYYQNIDKLQIDYSFGLATFKREMLKNVLGGSHDEN